MFVTENQADSVGTGDRSPLSEDDSERILACALLLKSTFSSTICARKENIRVNITF